MFEWEDKVDGQDVVSAEDINSIAHYLMELENSDNPENSNNCIKEIGGGMYNINNLELGIYRFTDGAEIRYTEYVTNIEDTNEGEAVEATYIAAAGDIVIVSLWKDSLGVNFQKIAHFFKVNGTIESVVPYENDIDFQVYHKLICETTEQWTFELEDGSTVTKNVVVK